MKKALVFLADINEQHVEKLKKAADGCELVFKAPAEVTQADLDAPYDAVVGLVPPKFLHGQSYELLQLSSAGADAYVKPGVLGEGTTLCCCTGAYSQTVSEHALASTLMLLKKLHLYRDDQAKHVWADEGTTGTIDGATVLVMGLGDIGRYYARMAKALGAYVIGVKRRPGGDKPEFVDELYTTDQFDEIVGRADVIFSVMPGTPATTHFYTLERFALMKPSAIFVNCGRGTAVSADVLYEALEKKLVAAAAVDVFETEPLPAESPLWDLQNLLLTPHASGFFHLPATINRVVDICADNLKAWATGGEYRNIVDFESGYKK